MKKYTPMIVAALSIFVFSGCNEEKSPTLATPAATETTPIASAMAKTVDSATAGVLKGKVLFDGVAPAPAAIAVKGNPECSVLHKDGTVPGEDLLVKDGNIQNAFVYIKEGLEGYSFEAPQTPAEMDNKTCMYVPHVIGLQVGQPLLLVNSDVTLHNIHAMPKNSKAFNIGLPSAGMKATRKFDAPEVMVPIKCDVHPWMKGYAGVLTHPYFQVTGEDGSFELKNLPPGDYTVEVWQEKLGTQSQKITIGSQETKEISFKYAAA